MRHFLTTLLLLGVLVGGYWLYSDRSGVSGLSMLQSSVCEQTLRYSIGTIDTRFGMSRAQFRDAIARAEEPWEKAAGRNLFQYDPDAAFTVNLVYSEQQQRTDQADRIASDLARIDTTLENISAEYRDAIERYNEQLTAFRQDRQAYEAGLVDYNATVERWNRRGGAPADVVAQLERRGQELDAQRRELERRRTELEALRREVNMLASRSQTLAERYNSQVVTYNDVFGGERQFDQGRYTGDRIAILQFSRPEELRLVLAHELGHALGLEHVSDPVAIMHRMMGQQDLTSLTLTAADRRALTEVCGDLSQ